MKTAMAASIESGISDVANASNDLWEEWDTFTNAPQSSTDQLLSGQPRPQAHLPSYVIERALNNTPNVNKVSKSSEHARHAASKQESRDLRRAIYLSENPPLSKDEHEFQYALALLRRDARDDAAAAADPHAPLPSRMAN